MVICTRTLNAPTASAVRHSPLPARTMTSTARPTVDQIRAARERLGTLVYTTPVRPLEDDAVSQAIGATTRLWLKEELFQRTGSFKPRGALTVMLDLDAEQLRRGVTGVSAGNHAISLGYSARILGSTAKVVMPKTANPFRIQLCKEFGVEVELVDDVATAFARVKEIEASEGRTFVHPYEGPKTALGTATVGLEFVEQTRALGVELDAVLVASGGGGLTAGVACAVKQMALFRYAKRLRKLPMRKTLTATAAMAARSPVLPLPLRGRALKAWRALVYSEAL